ncbi:hypothetical protein [Senegalia massiliensis]|uniref:Uncharacterized protein n=1 Tax=Senegalia massiliensis TaxID=1720316 RepID=A0A845R1C0_9CLOT|nr:hypothetical protein [Senegalia massiliensis]NBI08381.1 hypothetical protein [Senegalia massiliensis]
MGINNYNEHNKNKIIDKEAEDNINEYTEIMKKLGELSTNDKMLTNINSMDRRFKELVTNGSIDKSNVEYDMMENVLNQAKDIQIRKKNSVDKTIEFYDNCKNFLSISKRISD